MRSSCIEKDICSEVLLEFKEKLKRLEGKNILLAGANGFILSYLADTLALYNETSLKPINLYLVTRSKVSETSRLSHLKDKNYVEFITQDLSQKFNLPGDVHVIIHG